MTTIELPPTGLGTDTAVECCAGWLTAGAGEVTTVPGATTGAAGGGDDTTTEDGSDAQPASRPIAPQTANSASDGNSNPSARAEIFVFILKPRLAFWRLVRE